MKEIKGKEELLAAIKNSIKDGRDTAKELARLFKESIQPLRIESNEETFSSLAQHIQDLQHFMEFISELRRGLTHFDGFGLPEDPILFQETGLNLFRDMHSAFESKDWITLSDLIEYELCPLLLKEDEWLGALDEKLKGFNF